MTTQQCHRIDVHHHILPPAYVSALAGLGIHGGGGIPFPPWETTATLEMMDRQGIATAVTSISSPGVHFGDDEFARGLARECNEISARLVADYPQRFGGFATVPLPDVDGALREVEYALDTLGLDGVVLLASQSDGRYLGDPKFDTLFAELDRRRTVVFVHPTIPKSSESIPIGVPGFAAEFTFDTSRAVANLIWTGTVERYSNIRFILSHAGGTVPFLAWRWSLLDLHPTIGPDLASRAPRGVMHYLRQFHYDTALSANPHALRSLCELVDPSHILFGSDFPFAPEPVTQVSVEGISAYEGFDDEGRQLIERGNALKLLPRLQQRLDAESR
jgi:predicted TIM-barrel fold metal-dependent hydrolase